MPKKRRVVLSADQVNIKILTHQTFIPGGETTAATIASTSNAPQQKLNLQFGRSIYPVIKSCREER
jgi:hypothetical protein